MAAIKKNTDKAEALKAFNDKMGKLSAGAKKALNTAAGIAAALAIMFILAGPAKATVYDQLAAVSGTAWMSTPNNAFITEHKSWISRIWEDVKDNSHLNLGTDIAYGAGHDFINGKNYRGGIFSIYNYRKLHLEYGLLDPFKNGPVSHSIGSGIRIQPFINWARIPDQYKAIKQMYINTSTRYDLHHWGFMLLVHAGYGK